MANKTHVEICFEVAKLYVLSHLDSMHPNITVEQIQTAINKVGNALNDLPPLFEEENKQQ